METVAFLATHTTFSVLMFTILSLFIGSFLNVVIYRLPLMLITHWQQECQRCLHLPLTPQPTLNLCFPLSHCPQCKHTIKPWHNIPILSYLWLKGRCAACHAAISWRYPVVESLTAMSSGIVAYHFGWSIQTLVALCFTWASIALIFIDLDYHLLPDELTLALLWLGLLASLWPVFADPQQAILGASSAYLLFMLVQKIFYWLTGKIGLGGGDAKYLAALGALLGWQPLPIIVLIASLTGICVAMMHMLYKWQLIRTHFAFGPYLAIAGWAILLWQYHVP